MTVPELAERHQYTLVRPDATREDAVRHCQTAAEYGFRAVMIHPCWVRLAREVLRGSGVKVVTAICYPMGGETAAMKTAQAREVVRMGADEFDFQPNIGFLRSGMHDEFSAEIQMVVGAAETRPVKSMSEFGFLLERERILCITLTKAVLHGWQVSGFVSLLTGQPLSVSMQTDTAGIGRTVRANWTGSVNMPRTMAQWFDPAAFSAAAPLTFGNSPVDAVWGPGSVSWDMGIFRSFRLHERLKVQARLESYNVMNHFNLGNPGTSFGTANLGRIVNKSGPRNLQLGVKFLF